MTASDRSVQAIEFRDLNPLRDTTDQVLFYPQSTGRCQFEGFAGSPLTAQRPPSRSRNSTAELDMNFVCRTASPTVLMRAFRVSVINLYEADQRRMRISPTISFAGRSPLQCSNSHAASLNPTPIHRNLSRSHIFIRGPVAELFTPDMMSNWPQKNDVECLVHVRGGSSVGRALRSQCRGRGFDSLPLHSLNCCFH